jgi:hypothetical protein
MKPEQFELMMIKLRIQWNQVIFPHPNLPFKLIPILHSSTLAFLTKKERTFGISSCHSFLLLIPSSFSHSLSVHVFFFGNKKRTNFTSSLSYIFTTLITLPPRYMLYLSPYYALHCHICLIQKNYIVTQFNEFRTWQRKRKSNIKTKFRTMVEWEW